MSDRFITLATKISETTTGAFSFVWRDDLDFNASAINFELELRSFLKAEKRVSSWPGTMLDGEGATLRVYELNSDSLKIIFSEQNPLCFLSPSYPEDLAIYDAGRLVYSNCSHERLEWFS